MSQLLRSATVAAAGDVPADDCEVLPVWRLQPLSDITVPQSSAVQGLKRSLFEHLQRWRRPELVEADEAERVGTLLDLNEQTLNRMTPARAAPSSATIRPDPRPACVRYGRAQATLAPPTWRRPWTTGRCTTYNFSDYLGEIRDRNGNLVETASLMHQVARHP